MDQSKRANIAERIKAQRLANRLTQAALAEKVGVAQPTVGAWETGRLHPNQERIRALEKVIGKLVSGHKAEPYETAPIVQNWLSNALSRQNMTAVELSDESGVSPATIL